MPLYEYKCKSCGVVTEVLQKVQDPPMTRCVHCGGRLTKIISSPAIQFKGSGWYVTDYAKKESNNAKPVPKPAKETPEKTSPPPAQKQPPKD